MAHRSWWRLYRNLGSEALAPMVGLPQEKLEAYLDDRVVAAKVIGDRFDFLVSLYRLLSRQNSAPVIRQWFLERYAWLGNRTPRQVLSGSWYTTDLGPDRVLELARFKANELVTLSIR